MRLWNWMKCRIGYHDYWTASWISTGGNKQEFIVCRKCGGMFVGGYIVGDKLKTTYPARSLGSFLRELRKSTSHQVMKP